MTLRGLFVGADDRLRAPWRILLFLVVWVPCLLFAVAALAPARSVVDGFTGAPGTVEAIAASISLVLAHAVMLFWLDRRDWTYVGLHRAAAAPRTLAFGFAIGAAPIALASLSLLAVGWLVVQPAEPGSWVAAAVAVSAVLLPAAFYEELLSRGYLFSALSEWLGRVAAVALTSVGFGLLHVWNPGSTAGSIMNVVLAGVLLAAVLLATGSLYAAWLAHFAWNWVMAVPLHLKVSGLAFETPGYQLVDAGPDWATGGPWGPEGGAAATVAMLLAIWVLYLWSSRNLVARRVESPTTSQGESRSVSDQ